MNVNNRLRTPVKLLSFFGISSLILVLFLYIYNYSQNVPFLDEWIHSADLAISAYGHPLNINLIFRSHYGHINAISNAIIIISTYLNHWNLRQLVVINFVLGIAIPLLAICILRKHIKSNVIMNWAGFMITALCLSLLAGTIWTVSFYSFWLLNFLLLLLFIYLIEIFHPTWRLLFFLLIIAIIMTFNVASGLLIWLCAIPLLWIKGYRNYKYYLLWGIVAGLVIRTYYVTANLAIGQSSGDLHSSINIPSLTWLPQYALAYLGNIIRITPREWVFVGSPDYQVLFWWGLIGLSILTLNVLYLGIRTKQFEQIIVWMIPALFAIGTAILTIMGRSSGDTAIKNWWIPNANMFWLTILVISILLIQHLWSIDPSQRKLEHQLVLFLNFLFQFVWITLLLFSNLVHLQYMRDAYYPLQLIRPQLSPIEECYRDVPLSNDVSCLDDYPLEWGENYKYRINGLAARQLTLFAESTYDIQINLASDEVILFNIGDFDRSLSIASLIFNEPYPSAKTILLDQENTVMSDDIKSGFWLVQGQESNEQDDVLALLQSEHCLIDEQGLYDVKFYHYSQLPCD